MDALFTRRSIRKYTNQPVSEVDLSYILKAAMAAPSAGDQQPWHFIVINKRDILDQVPDVHPHAAMIKDAPAAVLVCGDESLEVHQGYWVQDCSAATENLLIAAEARSLGAVWLGVYPRETRVEGLQRLLGLPAHVIPFALIPIGHPAEKHPPAQRFNTERVKYNHW
jgi:nitroreductase